MRFKNVKRKRSFPRSRKTFTRKVRAKSNLGGRSIRRVRKATGRRGRVHFASKLSRRPKKGAFKSSASRLRNPSHVSQIHSIIGTGQRANLFSQVSGNQTTFTGQQTMFQQQDMYNCGAIKNYVQAILNQGSGYVAVTDSVVSTVVYNFVQLEKFVLARFSNESMYTNSTSGNVNIRFDYCIARRDIPANVGSPITLLTNALLLAQGNGAATDFTTATPGCTVFDAPKFVEYYRVYKTVKRNLMPGESVPIRLSIARPRLLDADELNSNDTYAPRGYKTVMTTIQGQPAWNSTGSAATLPICKVHIINVIRMEYFLPASIIPTKENIEYGGTNVTALYQGGGGSTCINIDTAASAFAVSTT